jgi:hypothetical protein
MSLILPCNFLITSPHVLSIVRSIVLSNSIPSILAVFVYGSLPTGCYWFQLPMGMHFVFSQFILAPVAFSYVVIICWSFSMSVWSCIMTVTSSAYAILVTLCRCVPILIPCNWCSIDIRNGLSANAYRMLLSGHPCLTEHLMLIFLVRWPLIAIFDCAFSYNEKIARPLIPLPHPQCFVLVLHCVGFCVLRCVASVACGVLLYERISYNPHWGVWVVCTPERVVVL